jgi:hypothetical protein
MHVIKEDHTLKASGKRKRPAASTSQLRIRWNGSSVRTTYTNAFKMSADRDEVSLFFGMNPAGATGPHNAPGELSDRIVMSPLAAKQLGTLLYKVIQDYESKYGVLNMESQPQTEVGPVEPPLKPPGSYEKSALFLGLIEDLNIECGFEKSFKMAEKMFLTNRFLLGIERKELQQQRLLDLCERMDMPGKYLETFKENLPDANIVLFGFEENERSCVYKVYLEFWDKVKRKIHNKPNKTDPVLLHLGFKWDALDNTRGAIARYTSYPLLSIKDILKRLSKVYDGHPDRTSFEIVKDIINLASCRAPNDLFIYLEVGEENNPRRSFDINLYKANLRLKELYPFLSKMRQHYSILSEEFDPFYEQVNTKLFGHLAGGIDREGKDFLTTYYEVEGF